MEKTAALEGRVCLAVNALHAVFSNLHKLVTLILSKRLVWGHLGKLVASELRG